MEQRRVNIRTSFPSAGHRSPHQSRVGTMIWASAGGHFLAPAPDLFIITVTAASAHTYVLCHWLGVSGLGDVSSLGSTAEGDSFTTMLSCDTDIVLAYIVTMCRAPLPCSDWSACVDWPAVFVARVTLLHLPVPTQDMGTLTLLLHFHFWHKQ